jgi:rubrerythrin
MADTTTRTESELIAELNDLLQLDYDAVQAYTVAIKSLQNESYSQQLREFRLDHERHIDELVGLIQKLGGTAVELPHLPTGLFKLAVQGIGATGGDRALLIAFKANERQVRDKYRRAAQGRHTPDVQQVIQRAAADEERHYAWVLETLEDLGYDADSASGRVESAFEVAHKGVADAVEGAERQVMRAGEDVRRALTSTNPKNALGAVLLSLGAGFVIGQLSRRD